MTRLVIELTNRCNLRCQHCFAERHATTGDLPLTISCSGRLSHRRHAVMQGFLADYPPGRK